MQNAIVILYLKKTYNVCMHSYRFIIHCHACSEEHSEILTQGQAYGGGGGDRTYCYTGQTIVQ